MIDEVQPADQNSRAKVKQGFHNTQQIKTQNFLGGSSLIDARGANGQGGGLLQSRGGSSGQQPGSRRELPNEKSKVQGVNNQSSRPGTAPQNLNGLLS